MPLYVHLFNKTAWYIHEQTLQVVIISFMKYVLLNVLYNVVTRLFIASYVEIWSWKLTVSHKVQYDKWKYERVLTFASFNSDLSVSRKVS